MHSKTVLASLLAFAVSLSASGLETPYLWTLADASLARNLDLLKASKELAAAEANAAAARAERLLSGNAGVNAGLADRIDSPNADSTRAFSSGGSLSASTASVAGSTLSLGVDYGYEDKGTVESDTVTVKAGANVPVLVNGRLIDTRLAGAARAAAIDLPLEGARETAAAKERETVDSALRLALDAAAADRAREIAERNAELAARELAIAQVRRDQGTLGYYDLAKAEKSADEARLAALEAALSRDRKLRALSAATGVDGAEIDLARIAAPGLGQDARFEALARGVAEYPSAAIRSAARAREIAEMERILAGTENAPRFALSSSATLPGPASRSREEYDAADKGSWSAQASVTVPLPTGLGAAKREAADARRDAARLGEESVRRASLDTLRTLRDALTSARSRVSLREDLLSAAESRLNDVRSAYAGQTATQLDVDRAQAAALEARSSLEDARAARFTALLDIYAFCGLDPRDLVKEIQP